MPFFLNTIKKLIIKFNLVNIYPKKWRVSRSWSAPLENPSLRGVGESKTIFDWRFSLVLEAPWLSDGYQVYLPERDRAFSIALETKVTILRREGMCQVSGWLNLLLHVVHFCLAISIHLYRIPGLWGACWLSIGLVWTALLSSLVIDWGGRQING